MSCPVGALLAAVSGFDYIYIFSDKSRWGFEGTKHQRLTHPLRKQPDGSYHKINWEEALKLATKHINAVSPGEIGGAIGPHIDLEPITAFRDFMFRLGVEHLEIRGNGVPNLDADFRSQYLMNSRITGVDDADLLFIVGGNPRTEAAVFNTRIRRNVKERGLKVFHLGVGTDLTYSYTHLGNSPVTLKQIAEGRHPFSAEL